MAAAEQPVPAQRRWARRVLTMSGAHPARAAPDDRLGLAPRRLGTTAGVGVVGCSGGGGATGCGGCPRTRPWRRPAGDYPVVQRGRGGVSVRLAAVSALVGCDGGRGDAGCGRRRRTRPWRLRSRLPGRACARVHGGGSVRLASTVVVVSASTWWSSTSRAAALSVTGVDQDVEIGARGPRRPRSRSPASTGGRTHDRMWPRS
jgi:hypothetical protein